MLHENLTKTLDFNPAGNIGLWGRKKFWFPFFQPSRRGECILLQNFRFESKRVTKIG